MIDLDAIEARLAAATPGHWFAAVDLDERDRYWDGSHVYAADAPDPPVSVETGDDLADEALSEAVSEWADENHAYTVCETHNYFPIPDGQHDANQRLIAHAPDDLRALLAHVADLRAAGALVCGAAALLAGGLERIALPDDVVVLVEVLGAAAQAWNEAAARAEGEA